VLFTLLVLINCQGGGGNNDSDEYGSEITKICSQKDLNSIREDLNGSCVLICDIALDSKDDGFDANGWIPIGIMLQANLQEL
jgi:hypothetical protein